MEVFLIKLFYLARPVLGASVDATIMGFSFFEFATIVFTGVLLLVFVGTLITSENKPLSGIEVWMLVFIIWCVLSSIVNYDMVVFESLVKWTLPPITYFILRRAIPNLKVYGKCLNWMMLGFLLPIGLSAFLTAKGLNVDEEIYKTGTQRYRGVYSGIHQMGHNTGILIMFIGIYIVLAKFRGDELGLKLSWLKYGFFVVVTLAAGYCLIHTHVRTVYIGLLIFIGVYLFFYSKKALILVGAGAIVAGIVYFSVIVTIFYDVLDTQYVGENYEKAGFGRTAIWSRNFDLWTDVPVDKKIAGVGIGNWVGNRAPESDDGFEQLYNSHNDWLTTMFESGIIGLIIILGLYFAMFRAIWSVQGRERYAYVALFLAVGAMNTLSNSYISRVELAQLLYMLLVYVELSKQPRVEAVAGEVPDRGTAGPRRILSYRGEGNVVRATRDRS